MASGDCLWARDWFAWDFLGVSEARGPGTPLVPTNRDGQSPRALMTSSPTYVPSPTSLHFALSSLGLSPGLTSTLPFLPAEPFRTPGCCPRSFLGDSPSPPPFTCRLCHTPRATHPRSFTEPLPNKLILLSGPCFMQSPPTPTPGGTLLHIRASSFPIHPKQCPRHHRCSPGICPMKPEHFRYLFFRAP